MAYSNAEISKHVSDLKKSGLSGRKLEDRVHADAKKFGVSGSQVEKSQGWDSGTVDNWTKQNNKASLSGGSSSSSSSPKPGNVSNNDIQAYAASIGGQRNGNSADLNNNQAFQVYQKAREYGVSDSQINSALGLSGDRTAQSWKRRMGLLQQEEEEQQPAFQLPQTSVGRNQTAAGQLDDMLASDSPLMQRAATQGRQSANNRGLLNSSMSAEAAQGAMIDRATPIAQQDAQTNFQNSQANADRQQQAFMADQNYGYNSALSSQDAQQSLDQLKATSTANGWGVMANNLTDIVGQYSQQLERIQANPDIQEADKTSMIEQVLSMRDADIDFQRSMYDQLPNYLANTGVFPDLA